MKIRDLISEIWMILNNINIMSRIPDVSLIRLWKLDENIEINDFIYEIKKDFNTKKENLQIQLKAMCLEKNLDNKFRDIDIKNNDKFLLEIKDSFKDSWFFVDKSSKVIENNAPSNIKRSFLSFLNSYDEETKEEINNFEVFILKCAFNNFFFFKESDKYETT